MKKIITSFTAPVERTRTVAKVTYPESKVLLDPTCTIEQILNRAQYGMPIPQKDVSGDLTSEEMAILGIDGTTFATASRMQLIDLKIRAQMRMNALQAKQKKLAEKAAKDKLLAELQHKEEQRAE